MKYKNITDRNASRLLAATGSAVAMLAPGVILAQTLEEIVVTAERREASLQDTPLSVAAFTPQAIEERVIIDMFDIQSNTPNLNIRPGRTQGATNPDFNIRGITGDGSQAAVAFYIDDVYFPSPNRNALRAVDIEAIEVLRGPQGTLFGRNSTGGAIRVTTRKPSEEFYANAELRAGDYGRADLEFDINVPLSDTFFMKANFASLNRDGYFTKVGVPGDQGKTGNIDDQMGSVAFRWLPSDDVTVDFKYRSEEQNGNSYTRTIEYVDLQGPLGFHLEQLNRALINDGQPGIVQNDPRLVLDDFSGPGFCFLFDNSATTWESECDQISRADNEQITAAVNWVLNDNHSLKFSLGQHDIWNQRAVDWLGWGAEVRHETYQTEATTAELVLNSELADGRIDLISGINYFDSSETEDRWVIRNHDPDNQAGTRDIWFDTWNTEAVGVFAQGTYHFANDATNLTVGLRHTNEDATATFQEYESGDFNIRGWNDCTTSSAISGEIVKDPSCTWIKSDGESWSETDYRLAIDHQISEPLMVYASLSKAYRAGVYAHPAGMGATDPAQYAPADYELAPTPPEEVTSLEIGLRSTWMDGRLRWNFTLFDMDQTNRQGFINDFSTGSVILIQTVLGDVTSKGWETDLDFAVTDDLTVNFSAGYTDAVIVGNPTSGTYYTGTIDQIQNTPEYAYSLAMNHTADVWGGELRTSLNYTWQDEMFGMNDPERDEFNITPAYGLLNGRITMSWPERGLSLSLEGTNLTDKTYARSTLLMGRIFHGPVPNDPNVRNYINYVDRAPPRMLSLVLSKDFGGN